MLRLPHDSLHFGPVDVLSAAVLLTTIVGWGVLVSQLGVRGKAQAVEVDTMRFDCSGHIVSTLLLAATFEEMQSDEK